MTRPGFPCYATIMPLAFESTTHGTFAFGFFNIEIDMLLLEELFFFAEHFCQAVVDLLAPHGASPGAVSLPGWRIDDPAAAGNVNLAISRRDLSGFVGETYQRFPFPDRPEGFKQKPHVTAHRPWAEAAIARYGLPVTIPVRRDVEAGTITVAEFAFDAPDFLDLVTYVDRGGYPRWEQGLRPQYVSAMMDRLEARVRP